MTRYLWGILDNMVTQICLDVKLCRRTNPIRAILLPHLMRIVAQTYRSIPWLTMPKRDLHKLLDQALWLEEAACEHSGIAFARRSRRTLSALQSLIPGEEVSL